MTTLIKRFQAADKRVSELEATLTIDYTIQVVPEYEEALKTAQNLYAELEAKGINPFA